MKISITRIWQNKYLKAALVALLWLAIWELVYLAVNSELLIASPFFVFEKLCRFAVTPSFWFSVLLSFLRIALGFFMGVLFGVLFAVLSNLSSVFNAVFSPLLKIIRSTPVVSFIILAWVWIERDFIPVFIALLMVMPIVWEGARLGIESITAEHKELAKVFNLSFSKRLLKIYIPSVLPAFSSSVITSLGLAWKSGIAAEVICSPALSIGTGLYNAKIYLETGELFAWTTVIIILSFLFEKLLTSALKKAGDIRHG